MKSATLPKPIKSKNPVVILRHVVKVITEEPKRYDQFTLLDRKADFTFPASDYFPSCGTVACVAGWTHLLTGGRAASAILDRAAKKLRLNQSEAKELFASIPPRVRRRATVAPEQHAADGVKHIKRFVKKKWGVTL